MFSTGYDEWETPQQIFDYFNDRFRFTLDVCASPENAKVLRYFTKEQNGLFQDWSGEICWMNPPYSDNAKWVQKAYRASLNPNTVVVCLLPSRTDTSWFHDYCAKGDIWFIRGRITFGNAKNVAPFPSMIVIFPKNWEEIIKAKRNV